MLTSDEIEADKKWSLEKSTLLDVIKPYLRKDLDMLELGCGIGRWSRVFLNMLTYWMHMIIQIHL